MRLREKNSTIGIFEVPIISGYRYYSSALGRWINRDPINELGNLVIRRELNGQLVGENLYLFVYNNSINNLDLFGLDTWQCSRKLGGPHKPAVPKTRKVRHDYLKIGDEYYSFGPLIGTYTGPGEVSVNTENDRGFKCHTEICDDEAFDDIIREVAESYVPFYNFRACESPNKTDRPCVYGQRNCKSWLEEVKNKAKDIYLEEYGACQTCFPVE